MATIPVTVTKISKNIFRYTWPNLQAGDQGEHIDVRDFVDFVYQVSGIFNGAFGIYRGSISDSDALPFQLLADVGGPYALGLSPTFPRHALALWPDVDSGDANTNLTFTLLAIL